MWTHNWTTWLRALRTAEIEVGRPRTRRAIVHVDRVARRSWLVGVQIGPVTHQRGVDVINRALVSRMRPARVGDAAHLAGLVRTVRHGLAAVLHELCMSGQLTFLEHRPRIVSNRDVIPRTLHEQPPVAPVKLPLHPNDVLRTTVPALRA